MLFDANALNFGKQAEHFLLELNLFQTSSYLPKILE
jgi:hypothetical protein